MAASYGSCCDLALEIVGPVGPTQLVWQGRPLPRRAWRRAMKVSAITLDIQQLEVADAARLRQLWIEDKGTAPSRTFTARLMRLANRIRRAVKVLDGAVPLSSIQSCRSLAASATSSCWMSRVMALTFIALRQARRGSGRPCQTS